MRNVQLDSEARPIFTYVTVTRHVNLGPLLRLSPSACPCYERALMADWLSPDRQDARTAEGGRTYRNVRFYPCYVWYSSTRAQSHRKLEFLITRTGFSVERR
jgi:hypothetical protein